MYNARCQPGYHALADHDTGCPFAAQLAADRGDRCDTWRVQQTEDEQARRGCRGDDAKQRLRGTKQHG